MPDKQWAEQFSRDVDAMLEQQSIDVSDSVPTDYLDMLNLAQNLARTDSSSESQIRESFRRRLYSGNIQANKEKIMQALPYHQRSFVLPAALFVVVLAGVILFASFGGGFFADNVNTEILTGSQVTELPPTVIPPSPTVVPMITTTLESRPIARIGNLTLTFGSTSAEIIVRQDDLMYPFEFTIPTPNYAFTESIIPEDIASNRLGGQLLIPAYVPAGYTLMLRLGGTTNTTTSVSTTYNHDRETLIIDQLRITDSTSLAVGESILEVITVRGQGGIWLEAVPFGWIANRLGYDPQTQSMQNLPVTPGQEVSLWDFHVLMWQEGDMLFRVMSDTLNRGELFRIAESSE